MSDKGEVEKSTSAVTFYCRPSEKEAWRKAFPCRELSRIIRALLNREMVLRKRRQGGQTLI